MSVSDERGRDVVETESFCGRSARTQGAELVVELALPGGDMLGYVDPDTKEHVAAAVAASGQAQGSRRAPPQAYALATPNLPSSFISTRVPKRRDFRSKVRCSHFASFEDA